MAYNPGSDPGEERANDAAEYLEEMGYELGEDDDPEEMLAEIEGDEAYHSWADQQEEDDE